MLAWTLNFILLLGPSLAQWDPNNLEDRQVIVHLFEWKWKDIGDECERFLGPKGFGGVQVSPPNEYVLAVKEVEVRPWWERYQPVSYKIISRSGDLNEFKEMVARCNKAGVRIYVDAVINHMTGSWPKNTTGMGGTHFDYNAEDYPGVPYTHDHFNDANCPSSSGDIESYDNTAQVRNCKLSGLIDLNQNNDYVRKKIKEYMDLLIDVGVAGFRIDASKHMSPENLKYISESLKDLNKVFFKPKSRPFIYQEVIDQGGEAISSNQYVKVGRVTEFKYGMELGAAFRKFKDLKWLRNFGEDWGFLNRHDALVFIDNHDNQRGHGGGGSSILTFRESRLYKMANAFMLSWPYGFTRVMSSYYWPQKFENGHDINNWMGPPHDDKYNILSPQIKADSSCAMDWICEHRWRQISNMVEFRNVVHGTDINDWWDNGKNQIAFCRGSKGFAAFNNDNHDLHQSLKTCLPPGTYCDVISGSPVNGTCTGKSITVGKDNKALISIKTSDEDGVVAIHLNSRIK